MNKEGSMYVDFHPDASNSENLFNEGKIGMIITAPWDLTSFPNVSYRVQFMPSFDPGGSHTTIAGPDNWVIFDNGADHVNASWQFLSFITSSENIRNEALATSHLPTRSSVWNAPGFSDEFDTKYPGQATFAANLSNLTKGRPQIPQYPAVSSALGIAIVDALLGKQTPQDALNAAATQADAALAIPT
jgi:multiple sugar transport system substrate-binding protein